MNLTAQSYGGSWTTDIHTCRFSTGPAMSNPISTDVTSTAMGLSWRHVVGVDFYEISFSPPINDDASAIIIKVFRSSSHEKTQNSHCHWQKLLKHKQIRVIAIICFIAPTFNTWIICFQSNSTYVSGLVADTEYRLTFCGKSELFHTDAIEFVQFTAPPAPQLTFPKIKSRRLDLQWTQLPDDYYYLLDIRPKRGSKLVW